MEDGSTERPVDAELMPVESDEGMSVGEPPAALAKIDAADVRAVFARVEREIEALPDTVKALEMRDGMKAVAAAAAELNRYDIREAAARAVAKVEQWIAKHNPPRPVGRPRKTDADENLGRRPIFSGGGSDDPADSVSEQELRDIRRAHPDPENDAALGERMERIEASGKVVSRRALRNEVSRERQGSAAERAPQNAPAADPSPDGPCAQSVPAAAAAAPLHVCAGEALRDQVDEDSIDAVAVALPGAEEALIIEVLDFSEWAVRPGGIILVRCPGWAVGEVTAIWAQPDEDDNCWVDYESLLICVGTDGHWWFPVLAFRRCDDDDADSAQQLPTLFRADTEVEAWRQVVAAWVAVGSELWDPCCGSGKVLVGAAAAGMRIVGADAADANVTATRAALEVAAGVAGDV